MAKGSGGSGLWRGMTALTASLCAIVVAGTVIAQSNAGTINSWFGTSNYKLETVSDEDTDDATYFDSEYDDVADLVEAKNELAEQISEEGSVLLKNNNDALPIDISSETVTLWGMNSHTPTLGGMIGSSVSVDSDSGQVEYDLETALSEKGFTLNQDMIDLYSSDEAMEYARTGFGATGHGLTPSFTATYEEPSSYQVGEIPASLYSDDVLASADDTVAVVVISRDASEAADYEPDMENGTAGDSFERPLALSDYEQDMIELAKQHSTKVVVLINSDNAMEIDELKNDDGAEDMCSYDEEYDNGDGTREGTARIPERSAGESRSWSDDQLQPCRHGVRRCRRRPAYADSA